MGIWGVSRSLRADADNNSSNISKFKNAASNGLLYTIPVIQLLPLYKFKKRLEFQYNNQLSIQLSTLPIYREFSGYCFDTI
jgi:hypothetical protein